MGVKGCAIHLSFSSGNGVLNAYKPPKSTRTQGGDTIADYITADTKLPAYLPYPRFLFKMEISQTAKLLYALLLDRSTLSQKNKWQDDEGRIYIIYPIAEIAEILDKGSTTIKGAGHGGAFGTGTGRLLRTEPAICESAACATGTVFRPTDGRKSDPHRAGKPTY